MTMNEKEKMKKVAIVGVEGSGKTVMLACLGELYTRPDEHGYFLRPENFETAAYVTDKITRMRKGEWPMATAEDAMQGLNWTLCRRRSGGGKPEEVCKISFLDFAGEVYRAAFGIRKGEDEALSDEIDQLNEYISEADDLIVLINLRDVIDKGVSDKRVQESVWITSSILDTVFNGSAGKGPRASIAITQADSYADTIRTYGGARGVLAEYLPHVSNSYDWLDIYDVTAVDKTVLDDDGNSIPAPDFKPVGLQVLMNWIINPQEKDSAEKPQLQNLAPFGGEDVKAPVPGTVLSVTATNGQKVSKGDEILVMDVMKMETPVTAPCDGTVTVMVNATDKVATGDTLAVIKKIDNDVKGAVVGADVRARVNILAYVFALVASGGITLACFYWGHWWIGSFLGVFFLILTLIPRKNKKAYQAVKWLLVLDFFLLVGWILIFIDRLFGFVAVAEYFGADAVVCAAIMALVGFGVWVGFAGSASQD